ncbi:MAG: hypothetical protein ABTQ34_00130 [Bdellovibrionales bacterium]
MYTTADKVQVWAKISPKDKPTKLVSALEYGSSVLVQGTKEQLGQYSTQKWTPIILANGKTGYVSSKALSLNVPAPQEQLQASQPQESQQLNGSDQQAGYLEDNGRDDSSNPYLKYKVKYESWQTLQQDGRNNTSWEEFDRKYDIKFACSECDAHVFPKNAPPRAETPTYNQPQAVEWQSAQLTQRPAQLPPQRPAATRGWNKGSGPSDSIESLGFNSK